MMNYNLFNYYILFFITGAFLSSFYYLIVCNRENGKDFTFDNKNCGKSKNKLIIWNIIPIFSYIFNKEKCQFRICKIGLYKLLSELIVGILVTLMAYKNGLDFSLIILIFEITIIFYIGFIDYLTGYIYNIDLFLLLVLDIIYKAFFNNYIYQSARSSLILGGIFLLIYLSTKMIGIGDCIYAFICGFITTSIYEVFVFFNCTFIIAAIISIILIIAKRKTLKDSISFGPFMSLSLIIILFLR